MLDHKTHEALIGLFLGEKKRDPVPSIEASILAIREARATRRLSRETTDVLHNPYSPIGKP